MKGIEMAVERLLSCDLWDTILRRRCHPDSIKLHLCSYLLTHHLSKINSTYHSLDKLFKLRLTVEKRLFEKYYISKSGEYSAEEVIEEWIKVVCSPNENNLTIKSELISEEISYEKDVIYLDKNILNLLSKFDNYQKVILTDFYYSKNHILNILSSFPKVLSMFSNIISSSDIGANKFSGSAYQYLISNYNLTDKSDWIHIGDNSISDGIQARKYGARVILYKEFARNDHSAKEKMLKALVSEDTNALMSYITAFTRSYQSTPISGNIDMYKMGVKLTPMLYCYCSYIYSHAIQSNISKVFFCTREGIFFRRIFDIYQSSIPLRYKKLDTKIIEVSRMSTFFPSLNAVNSKELMRMWNQYSSQSIKTLFISLGLQLSDFKSFLTKYSLNPHKVIQYPWNHIKLQKMFSDPNFQSMIGNKLALAKNNIFEYFFKRGLHNTAQTVAICDIGWRGSIQDNLGKLFPKVNFVGYYLGLNFPFNTLANNIYKYGCLADNYNYSKGLSGTDKLILDNVSPVEMLFNSSVGSVLGYSNHNGKVVAIYDSGDAERRVYEKYISSFQQGIIDFIPHFSEWAYENTITCRSIRQVGSQLLAKELLNPSTKFLQSYAELFHNEKFGAGITNDKSLSFSYYNYYLRNINRKSLLITNNYLKKTGWINWMIGFKKYHKVF